MGLEAIVGSIAAIASVLGYVPQVLKSWRTRRAEDISTSMVLLLLFSLSSWLVYGLLLENLPLIATNTVSLNLLLLLLAAKLKFGRKKTRKKGVADGQKEPELQSWVEMPFSLSNSFVDACSRRFTEGACEESRKNRKNKKEKRRKACKRFHLS